MARPPPKNDSSADTGSKKKAKKSKKSKATTDGESAAVRDQTNSAATDSSAGTSKKSKKHKKSDTRDTSAASAAPATPDETTAGTATSKKKSTRRNRRLLPGLLPAARLRTDGRSVRNLAKEGRHRIPLSKTCKRLGSPACGHRRTAAALCRSRSTYEEPTRIPHRLVVDHGAGIRSTDSASFDVLQEPAWTVSGIEAV
jgi:hypothetical protein